MVKFQPSKLAMWVRFPLPAPDTRTVNNRKAVKMKALFCAHPVGALVFLGFASMAPLATAGAPSTCDDISKDVREAVSKDPSKVLMIVEDALVINESCACEIIKAAITASNADAATVKQIVQTGLAVAPKMAAVIAECANAVAPGSGDAVAALSADKADAKNPGGKVAPAPAITEGTDFGAWATNIRGVYLIQPAAAGFVTQVVEEDDTDDDEEEDDADSRRTRRRIPLSPAQAQP